MELLYGLVIDIGMEYDLKPDHVFDCSVEIVVSEMGIQLPQNVWDHKKLDGLNALLCMYDPRNFVVIVHRAGRYAKPCRVHLLFYDGFDAYIV